MTRYDVRYIIRRVIVAIIVSLILMFIGNFKVNASEYNTVYMPDFNVGGPYTLIGMNSNLTINTTNSPFSNFGKGTIIFTFTISHQISINSVELYTTNYAGWTCDIGTNAYYRDNVNQLQTYTAKCNVANVGPSGIIRLKINGFAWDTGAIYFSTFWNGVKESSSANYSQDIANIYNAINNSSTQDRQYAEQQHQDLQDINNSINSEEAPSQNEVSNNTSDWSSNNATNGTITNLLTLPITLLNGYISGINSSCTSFNLGSLYGTNLTLPCINVANYIGSTLWGVIDILFSGFMIFAIGKKLVRIFNDFTNLRDNQIDELYGGGA